MNKTYSTAFLLALLMTQAGPVLAASPVYVNKSYTKTSSEGYLFGVNAFSSISEAVRAVDAKGIVYISEGFYPENILIEKSISLIGKGSMMTQGASPTSPVIDGGKGTTTATITVNGIDDSISVTLKNLTITSGGSGINVLQNSSMMIDRNTLSGYHKNGITFGPMLFPGQGGIHGSITRNLLQGKGPTEETSQNGIQIAENNTAIITDNIISNHVYMVPNSYWGTGVLIHRSGNILVRNNIIRNNQAGVNIIQGSRNKITKNTISGDTLSQAGVMISSSDDKTKPATSNTITGNTISGGFIGIWTSYTHGNIYNNNTIKDTTGNGIYSWGSDENTFIGNKISSIRSKNGNAWTIALDGGDTTESIGSDNSVLKNNTISNSDNGIYIAANSNNTKLEGNLLGASLGILDGGTQTVSTPLFALTTKKSAVQKGQEGRGMVLGASTVSITKNLTLGSSGEEVTALQMILVREKLLEDTTGYFGPKTKEALVVWQKNNKLTITGTADTESRALLNTK